MARLWCHELVTLTRHIGCAGHNHGHARRQGGQKLETQPHSEDRCRPVALDRVDGRANSWTEKGCTLPQGYMFVISHGGRPDRDQGCEDEPGGPGYTDQYYG
jgi:hypothetical protein